MGFFIFHEHINNDGFRNLAPNRHQANGTHHADLVVIVMSQETRSVYRVTTIKHLGLDKMSFCRRNSKYIRAFESHFSLTCY